MKSLVKLIISIGIKLALVALLYAIAMGFSSCSKGVVAETYSFSTANNQEIIDKKLNYLKVNKDYSLLDINIRTGRKNQIRVQLSNIGNPILGDNKYSGKKSKKLCLCANRLDIKDITDDYTVYDYQKDSRKCIEDIESRGKLPILVGGTGLYIKAALYNYEFDEMNIKNDYSALTNDELYNKLLSIDKNTTIHNLFIYYNIQKFFFNIIIIDFF